MGRLKPQFPKSGQRGDKAYSSRRNRRYLRRRQIRHTIPELRNQRANRQQRGSKRGRPIGFDKRGYIFHGTVIIASIRLGPARDLRRIQGVF